MDHLELNNSDTLPEGVRLGNEKLIAITCGAGLKLTNLMSLKINNVVNVELDILSKYIYKYSN